MNTGLVVTDQVADNVLYMHTPRGDLIDQIAGPVVGSEILLSMTIASMLMGICMAAILLPDLCHNFHSQDRYPYLIWFDSSTTLRLIFIVMVTKNAGLA